MSNKLKKIYFILLVPSILSFVLTCWVKAYDVVAIDPALFPGIVGPLIFILCIALAIAFPIFYRSFFAYKHRDQLSVAEDELLKFERTLIHVVMVTPYLALFAFLIELPRFYTAGAVLMGIYAVYYFYPSGRRIAFDRRIFRAV
jgi:Ca2+/Na+ antiporter